MRPAQLKRRGRPRPHADARSTFVAPRYAGAISTVWTFESGEEARGAHGAAGSGAVTAPMPGKVVAVLVAEGDVVEAGQALVVLEAMKMESTLAAEVAGRVTAVRATAGASVAAGDLLAKQWGDWGRS